MTNHRVCLLHGCSNSNESLKLTEIYCAKHKYLQPPTAEKNKNDYYGGDTNPYEAIKVIDAWKLNFALGNVLKYISRAGKKNPDTEIEDLEKALWYLKHEMANRKKDAK